VRLGRNAQSIYQDLVEQHGFAHPYNSVKRFVRRLKARAPERYDLLEFLPGEEVQVDFGQGAPTRTASGRYRRPHLSVMTLKYSGKAFRKGGVEGRPGELGAAARGSVAGVRRLCAVHRPEFNRRLAEQA
jgi:S1-C subfamily serine protease